MKYLKMKNKILLIILLVSSISYSQQIERIEPPFGGKVLKIHHYNC